jgi:hypothetical protein
MRADSAIGRIADHHKRNDVLLLVYSTPRGDDYEPDVAQ